MANLDTRSKRASSVQLLQASILSLVLPDGTIASADKAQTLNAYSGIAAASPSGTTFVPMLTLLGVG